MTIAENLAEVRARIASAARESGRDPAEIQLVAVSKKKSADLVREAYAAGQRAFGENYAQELESKVDALRDLDGIAWHMIGHVQTNKAKFVARVADAVHTVDSAALARELSKRIEAFGRPRLPILIEVNVSGEPQKHGARASELQELIDAVHALPSLELRGLMTVPPRDSLDDAARTFSTLASLRNLHGGTAALPDLSIGMSHDLEVAIACGATIVRIGTAIFGGR